MRYTRYTVMKYSLIILWVSLSFSCNIQGQIITTFAGGGSGGDGGPATSAIIPDPIGGVFDKYGNYYCASGIGGCVIRKVSNAGIITTVAGNGTPGFCGDGLAATAACLNAPTGVQLDSVGNLYIADHANFRIRKVNITTSVITTIAGTGTYGYNGDNILATAAQIWADDVCVDKYGNVYIADFDGRRVRKIDTMGVIHTIAGTGVVGSAGDGGPATAAQLNPGGSKYSGYNYYCCG